MENEQTYTAPAPQSAPVKKIRRVGTFTLGITLVAVGILLLLSLFLPSLDLLRILRFAPVLLVILGAEVLLYAGRPDIHLKYDWLSMFVCACLIFCGVGAGLLQKAVAYLEYAPQLEQVQRALAQQMEKSCYTALGSRAALVHSMTTNVDLCGDLSRRTMADMTVEDLQPGDAVYLYFTLQKQYPDVESFAADCKAILDAAELVVPSEAHIRLDTLRDTQAQGDGYFNLELEGPWQRNVDAAALVPSITGTWQLDGSEYSTRADWEAALAARDAEQTPEAETDTDAPADTAESAPAEDAVAQAGTASGQAAEGEAVEGTPTQVLPESAAALSAGAEGSAA